MTKHLAGNNNEIDELERREESLVKFFFEVYSKLTNKSLLNVEKQKIDCLMGKINQQNANLSLNFEKIHQLNDKINQKHIYENEILAGLSKQLKELKTITQKITIKSQKIEIEDQMRKQSSNPIAQQKLNKSQQEEKLRKDSSNQERKEEEEEEEEEKRAPEYSISDKSFESENSALKGPSIRRQEEEYLKKFPNNGKYNYTKEEGNLDINTQNKQKQIKQENPNNGKLKVKIKSPKNHEEVKSSSWSGGTDLKNREELQKNSFINKYQNKDIPNNESLSKNDKVELSINTNLNCQEKFINNACRYPDLPILPQRSNENQIDEIMEVGFDNTYSSTLESILVKALNEAKGFESNPGSAAIINFLKSIPNCFILESNCQAPIEEEKKNINSKYCAIKIRNSLYLSSSMSSRNFQAPSQRKRSEVVAPSQQVTNQNLKVKTLEDNIKQKKISIGSISKELEKIRRKNFNKIRSRKDFKFWLKEPLPKIFTDLDDRNVPNQSALTMKKLAQIDAVKILINIIYGEIIDEKILISKLTEERITLENDSNTHCCSVFSAYNIEYDNKLLNSMPRLTEVKATTGLSFCEIIQYSQNLQDLGYEIPELDHEFLCCLLISFKNQ